MGGLLPTLRVRRAIGVIVSNALFAVAPNILRRAQIVAAAHSSNNRR